MVALAIRPCRYFLALVLLATVIGCSSGPQLRDAEAAAIVESAFNVDDVGLLLGPVAFVSDKADSARGQDLLREYPIYVEAARQGLIEFKDQRDLTRGFSGWDAWLGLTQSGIRQTATVTETEAGKKSGTIRMVGPTRELWLHVAQSKVQAIVTNVEELVGVDRYRVATGTHTYTVPAEWRGAWAAAHRDDASIEDRRFRVLLKFDDVLHKWHVAARDLGSRTVDFPTNVVGQQLQQLKSGAR